jgi:dihydroorotase-like cyclic amidohydrolase
MPRTAAETATAEALRRVEQRTERKARASATCLGGVARGALTTQRVAENVHLIHRRLC